VLQINVTPEWEMQRHGGILIATTPNSDVQEIIAFKVA
jgi:hypothetical protein